MLGDSGISKMVVQIGEVTVPAGTFPKLINGAHDYVHQALGSANLAANQIHVSASTEFEWGRIKTRSL